jgi:hypothetical protein
MIPHAPTQNRIKAVMEERNVREIEIIRGSTRILLIAPHGFVDDEENTGVLARAIADRLGCYAMINECYRKPRKSAQETPDKERGVLNLNRLNQVETHLKEEFLEPLLEIVHYIIQNQGQALVFWIHGIRDQNIHKAVYAESDGVHVVLGIGQGDPERITAPRKTAKALRRSMRQNPIRPINAHVARKGSDYCGWHPNIMNQLFVNKGYDHSSVQSIQLEIKYTGFRDSQVGEAAAAFAEALAPFAVLKTI